MTQGRIAADSCFGVVLAAARLKMDRQGALAVVGLRAHLCPCATVPAWSAADAAAAQAPAAAVYNVTKLCAVAYLCAMGC